MNVGLMLSARHRRRTHRSAWRRVDTTTAEPAPATAAHVRQEIR